MAIAIDCYMFYKDFVKTLLVDATRFTEQSSIPIGAEVPLR